MTRTKNWILSLSVEFHTIFRKHNEVFPQIKRGGKLPPTHLVTRHLGLLVSA